MLIQVDQSQGRILVFGAQRLDTAMGPLPYFIIVW